MSMFTKINSRPLVYGFEDRIGDSCTLTFFSDGDIEFGVNDETNILLSRAQAIEFANKILKELV